MTSYTIDVFVEHRGISMFKVLIRLVSKSAFAEVKT